MANQNLIDYIRQQFQQGASKEEIKNTLLANGWQEKDIDEALNLTEQRKQPVFDSVPETTFSQPDVSPVKSHKKLIALIISAVVGVAIIGGGIFGYFYYFQSPERIVQKMIERMSEVKSLEYEVQIGGEIDTTGLFRDFYPPDLYPPVNNNPQQPLPAKFSIDFSGASDLHDLNNPKEMFSFDINTDTSPKALGLEVRIIDGFFYLRLRNIPDFGTAPGLLRFLDLSLLENQWIEIDPETAKNEFGLEEMEGQFGEVQKEKDWSLEQKKQIKDAVARAKIFKITENLPAVKINGISAYHYKFIVDKEGVTQLFEDITEITQKRSLTGTESQEMDDLLQAIETPEGEIWIGKKDLLIHKILLSVGVEGQEKTNISGKITITAEFKNYNQTVQIDIPAPVKTLKEVMRELFGAFFSEGLQNISPGFQLPSQLPQLPGETIYFNNGSNVLNQSK